MKLGLVSKSDLKKFHEWFTDKIGELSHMELEDIALEAFMAGMRENESELDRKTANEVELLDYIHELEHGYAEAVKLHDEVASELNTANHKLMQIEDLSKRESGLTKRAPDSPKPFVNHCNPVNGVHAPFCNGDHSASG